jgi:hypothetical protein
MIPDRVWEAANALLLMKQENRAARTLLSLQKVRPRDMLKKARMREDGVYIVLALMGRRMHKRGVQYLVRWQGFGTDEATWEDAKGIPSSFKKKYDEENVLKNG